MYVKIGNIGPRIKDGNILRSDNQVQKEKGKTNIW
jgi:hypothetical protein